MDENRERAMELAIGQIEKQFGKGSIMKLGSDAVAPDISAVSTGSLSLDIALGVGGVPRGRVIEIYGPESSGKTTLSLQIVAEAQKLGRHLCFCGCRARSRHCLCRQIGCPARGAPDRSAR